MYKRVSNLLMELGVPVSIKGFNYLREAILLTISDPEYKECITKRLYPDVAKKFNTTSSRVERAIRHAIGVTLYKGNRKKLEQLFGYNARITCNITNGEFISVLVEKISLEAEDTEKTDIRHIDEYPDYADDPMSEGRSVRSYKDEIKSLKDHIIELRISSIKNSIPRGHCPYAYYELNSDFDCGDMDCDRCKAQFFEIMEKKITEQVYASDYVRY